jgi:hypothetical protein
MGRASSRGARGGAANFGPRANNETMLGPERSRTNSSPRRWLRAGNSAGRVTVICLRAAISSRAAREWVRRRGRSLDAGSLARMLTHAHAHAHARARARFAEVWASAQAGRQAEVGSRSEATTHHVSQQSSVNRLRLRHTARLRVGGPDVIASAGPQSQYALQTDTVLAGA